MLKIYTRTGDHGETMLFSGKKIRKDDAHIRTLGAVDELNALLGVLTTLELPQDLQPWVKKIQHQLFELGTDLATPTDASAKTIAAIQRLSDTTIVELEQHIDQMTQALAPLANFILPGGTPASAITHLARTVCRRAETEWAHLSQQHSVNPVVGAYLNRLSDWLFTAARWINHQAGVVDTRHP